MTQWGVTLRSEAIKGLLLSIEEVDGPSLTNGGGISLLLQLHPRRKKTLCLWGKVRKGAKPSF